MTLPPRPLLCRTRICFFLHLSFFEIAPASTWFIVNCDWRKKVWPYEVVCRLLDHCICHQEVWVPLDLMFQLSVQFFFQPQGRNGFTDSITFPHTYTDREHDLACSRKKDLQSPRWCELLGAAPWPPLVRLCRPRDCGWWCYWLLWKSQQW